MPKLWKKLGHPFASTFFEKGGHRFSLRAKEPPLSIWPDLYLQWLRDKDVIEEVTEQEKKWELAKNWRATIRR